LLCAILAVVSELICFNNARLANPHQLASWVQQLAACALFSCELHEALLVSLGTAAWFSLFLLFALPLI
jgi:hypothetical protein